MIRHPGSNSKPFSGIYRSYGHVQIADLNTAGPGDGKVHFFLAGIDDGKCILVNGQGSFFCLGCSRQEKQNKQKEQ